MIVAKKIIFTIGIILLILFLVNTNKTTKNVTTIQYSTWGSESEIRILEPLIKDFEQKNPDIKIDLMHIPQNYFQKIHLLFASNTAPDVIFINNQYLPVYANANLLEDLSNYKNEFEIDKFFPKSLKSMQWKGKLYAIPRDVSNLVVYYNKDLFRKNAVKYPNEDWTLNDFLTIAKKLTKSPSIFGVSFDENPLFYLPYIMSEGYINTPYFDDIKNTDGLKFYADLRNKYHVAPKREESASATMAQMFLQQRLGMQISGRWLVPIYRRDAKFDWDVAPFPKGKSGSIVPLDSSGWAISKHSNHKKEALKFIQYISSKESSDKFALSGLIVPARIDSANSANFLNEEKPINAKVFLSVIETSIPTPVTLDFREVLDELKSKTENIFVTGF